MNSIKPTEIKKIDNRNSKIPTLKSSETIHEFCKKSKDMAPGLARMSQQKYPELHMGQGDGPALVPLANSEDIDERSKNILMGNLESSLKTPEECPYEANEDYKYEDDDYEDDYSDDDDNNLSNSDGQDVVIYIFLIYLLQIF